MAQDMPEPCKFSSLDSCLKKFMWANKKVDLVVHLVFGLVLQVDNVETHSYTTSTPTGNYLQRSNFFFFGGGNELASVRNSHGLLSSLFNSSFLICLPLSLSFTPTPPEST